MMLRFGASGNNRRAAGGGVARRAAVARERPALEKRVGELAHVAAVAQPALAGGEKPRRQRAPVETVLPEVVGHAAWPRAFASASFARRIASMTYPLRALLGQSCITLKK